jgi:cytochrome c oxidase assembly factor 4
MSMPKPTHYTPHGPPPPPRPSEPAQATGVAGSDEEEDPYDARISKTGCKAENDAVLLCHFETKDWTKCRAEVQRFKECFDRYQRVMKKGLNGEGE